MSRNIREVLLSIAPSVGLGILLYVASGEQHTVAHSALTLLGKPEIALAQGGTIPDPTPTIEVTEPITPTLVPTPTPTPQGPYTYNELTIHAFQSNGVALPGVPVEIIIGNSTTQHTTDETGQAQTYSNDATVTDFAIRVVGSNDAESAEARFSSTNTNFDTATISAGSPSLTAELVVEFPPISAAQDRSTNSVVTTISGSADAADNSLHIEASTGVAATVEDFEVDGELTIDQSGEIVGSSSSVTQARSSEVVIFGETADPDGFTIQINNGGGLIAHTDIPASMFTGGSLSINTDQITTNTQTLNVAIDADNNGTNEEQAKVETEVTEENPVEVPPGNKVLLPIAIR